MDKILLVIDGIEPSIPALDFACYLGRLTRSKITGVFLENQPAEQKPVLKTVHGSPILDWELDEASPEYVGKQKMIEANITRFKEACTCRSVQCNVHRDTGVHANEIISESRH